MSGPSNVYSQNAGTTPLLTPVPFASAPSAAQVNYPLGQVAVVESTNSAYMLTSKSTSNGIVSATWTLLTGVGSGIATLTTTNNGGTVTPSAGNVALTGTGNIAAVGSGSTVSVGLTGITNHAVLVGGASNTITDIGPLTNGQLLIGSTGANPVPAVLTSTGATVTITNGPGTINLEATGGGGGSVTIAGDSGSISGSSLTIYANQAGNNSGSSVGFSNSGAVSSLNLSDGNSNTILGQGSGNATMSGGGNCVVGTNSFNSNSDGNVNCVLGVGCLASNVSGSNNVAISETVLSSNISGNENCGIGSGSLSLLTTGNSNSAYGGGALSSLLTGSTNCALGGGSGSAYSGGESNNVLLVSPGVEGESNVMRLGDPAFQAAAYIAAVAGTSVSNAINVTINSSSGQLGSSPNLSGVKVLIPTGTNASIGTSAAMVAGNITVATTAVTANSKIFLSTNTVGGTQGFLSAPTGSIVAGTSFVIHSSSVTDTSTVNWWIVN